MPAVALLMLARPKKERAVYDFAVTLFHLALFMCLHGVYTLAKDCSVVGLLLKFAGLKCVWANKALTGYVSNEARPVSHANNLPVKSILASHILHGGIFYL